MADDRPLLVGEYLRRLDDRYRITLPGELVQGLLAAASTSCVLAKERYGALSLWNCQVWRERVESGIRVVEVKLQQGKLADRTDEVQQFARLLSSRFRQVNVAGRGRLLVPEGFREFLAVGPNEDCFVVGAGLSVELWHPVAWRRYLKRRIPSFHRLIQSLSE